MKASRVERDRRQWIERRAHSTIAARPSVTSHTMCRLHATDEIDDHRPTFRCRGTFADDDRDGAR